MRSFGWRAARAVGILLIAGGLGLGLLSLRAPPPAALVPPSIDTVTETFVRIAVGAEPYPIRTWRNEVRMLVNGAPADEVRPLLEQAAPAFAGWTGVATTVVNVPEDGFNVLVNVVPREEYTRVVTTMGGGGEGGRYLEENLVCYSTALSRTDSPALLRATVVIPDDLAAEQRQQCVWHELMHVFGIFGHPDERFASVLRNANEPTATDVAMIRALYDPRLAEVRAADAAVRARAVLEDLLDPPEGARFGAAGGGPPAN